MQRRLSLLCLGCGDCHVGTVLDDEAERHPDDPTAMRNAESQPILVLGFRLCTVVVRGLFGSRSALGHNRR